MSERAEKRKRCAIEELRRRGRRTRRDLKLRMRIRSSEVERRRRHLTRYAIGGWVRSRCAIEQPRRSITVRERIPFFCFGGIRALSPPSSVRCPRFLLIAADDFALAKSLNVRRRFFFQCSAHMLQFAIYIRFNELRHCSLCARTQIPIMLGQRRK